MSKARGISNLVDTDGDVVSGALDNVPPSNDASALTTGTLPVDRVPYIGRRNLIINGAMQVAQRGTSNTSFTFGYALDRMYLDQFSATGGTHTYQQLSSDPPVGFRNYLRWQRNSGETATGAMRIYYTGETGASDGIAGNKLTLSFYARAGADYSGGNLETRIVTGEGTDQSRSGWANGLWTNQVNDSQSNTLTTSWQRFTHTLASACGNDVSQHALRFVWTPTGTASTNDYIEITGVQLEVGTVATPFEHRSYGEELALCQRYYQRAITSDSGDNLTVGGSSAGSTTMRFVWPLSTPLRSSPTITQTGTGWKRFNDSAESSSTATPTVYKYYATASYIGLQVTSYSGTFGDNRVASASPQNLTALNFDSEL